ncbi:MAG: hypothetical protein ACYC35_15210 [Pirellulales bacterium]
MRRYALVLFAVLMCPLFSCGQVARPTTPQSSAPIKVFFSPKGGCTEAVVNELNAASCHGARKTGQQWAR